MKSGKKAFLYLEWRRYSINQRISKSTQISFLSVLFERTGKIKFINKKSDSSTQVRRRGDFLKILFKNRKKLLSGTRDLPGWNFFRWNKILWTKQFCGGGVFQNFISVMSYESCVLFEYFQIMTHVWVIHMHVAYCMTPNLMKISMVEKFLRSAHANFLKYCFLKMRGRDRNFD